MTEQEDDDDPWQHVREIEAEIAAAPSGRQKDSLIKLRDSLADHLRAVEAGDDPAPEVVPGKFGQVKRGPSVFEWQAEQERKRAEREAAAAAEERARLDRRQARGIPPGRF